jgi:hypothetical protein
MEVQAEGKEALENAEAAIEAFADSSMAVVYEFQWPDAGGSNHPIKFTQATLGLFPAQEFITMMTRIINDVLEGKYEVDVMQLFRDRDKLQNASVPTDLDEDSVERTIEEWKPYIQGFLKLVDVVPGLQQDIIALSLGVRKRDREIFKERIAEAPHNGGITIDQGVDIIKIFIRQNAKVLRRFLGRQIREIGEELMNALEEERKVKDTNGGTPSSTSSQPIPASV